MALKLLRFVEALLVEQNESEIVEGNSDRRFARTRQRVFHGESFAERRLGLRQLGGGRGQVFVFGRKRRQAACFERFLQGTEPVHIAGMTLSGPIEFAVPVVRPQIDVVVAGSPTTPRAELETLWIEPDDNRATLTWRASLPVDRKVLKVEMVTIRLPPRGAPS